MLKTKSYEHRDPRGLDVNIVNILEKLSSEKLIKTTKKKPRETWYSLTAMLKPDVQKAIIKATEKSKPKKAIVMLDKDTIEFAEKHGIDINKAVKQHLERLKAKFGN